MARITSLSMRGLLVISLLLALAACAQIGGPAPDPSIDWRTEVRGGDLLVRLADRRGYYRVERVALVAPSGRSYPATELTREVVRDDDRYYPYGPGVGVGGGFGSSGSGSVGVGVSVPLGGGYERGERAWTEARIPLPSPPRSVGPDWKIVIGLSDRHGVARVAELPAPAIGN
jgi:hypothetical protein